MSNKSFDAKYLAYLAQFIRKREGKAFAELYSYTYQKLYAFAYRFLKDPHLAQDALQEIYISVYKNITSLKNDALFWAWINQIAYHVCCDFARKAKNTQYEHTDFSSDPKVLNLASGDDCFLDISNKEFLEHLKEALDSLPFRERQAFTLRFEYDFKLEEIAALMECSLSSVKRYLKSARKALAKRLRSYHI